MLEDRKKELEENFKSLENEKQSLVEQNRVIQQKLNEIAQEQLRLQGSYREIENLMKNEPKLKVAPD